MMGWNCHPAPNLVWHLGNPIAQFWLRQKLIFLNNDNEYRFHFHIILIKVRSLQQFDTACVPPFRSCMHGPLMHTRTALWPFPCAALATLLWTPYIFVLCILMANKKEFFKRYSSAASQNWLCMECENCTSHFQWHTRQSCFMIMGIGLFFSGIMTQRYWTENFSIFFNDKDANERT